MDSPLIPGRIGVVTVLFQSEPVLPEFFASIATWNDGRVEGYAFNDNTSFSQWYMDITFKNGFQYKATQVAVRKWKDGKVVHERFFYNKG